MKNTLSLKNIFVGMFLLTSASLSATEEIPIGKITALDELVQVGATSRLNWEISYPASVIFQDDDEGDQTAGTEMIMKVRVITCAIGPQSTIDFGVTLNGGSYQRFYNGVGESNKDYALTPGTVVAETLVAANNKIELMGRHSGTRLPGSGWVSSADSSQSALVLQFRNGDTVPTLAGAGNQRSLAEILAPYSENGIVSIGKNEVIHCFELLIDKVNRPAFDRQDLVTLTTYEQVPLSQ